VLLEKVFDNIDACIKAKPEITFHLEAYHYEERRHTSTDKDGNTHETVT